MAYRDDSRDLVEAPTADGVLRAELGPRHVKLAVGQRSIDIADAFVTVVEHHRKQPARDRRTSIRIEGRLVIARDVSREGFGIWLEVEPGRPRGGMRRIFGVEPINLLEPAGLDALAVLDRLAQRLRHELAERATDVRRAFEIGAAAAGGLDKVLVIDHGDHWVVFARRLFRDRARFAVAVYDDGRVIVRDRGDERARAMVVRSRHGVTVVGDFVRFADEHGADLARISIPWLTPEERGELARRIGQLVDREAPAATAWPPRLEHGADREP